MGPQLAIYNSCSQPQRKSLHILQVSPISPTKAIGLCRNKSYLWWNNKKTKNEQWALPLATRVDSQDRTLLGGLHPPEPSFAWEPMAPPGPQDQ